MTYRTRYIVFVYDKNKWVFVNKINLMTYNRDYKSNYSVIIDLKFKCLIFTAEYSTIFP